MQDKEFLFEYLNTESPVGYEVSGQKVWMSFMKNHCDEFITDTYGSVAAVINPGKEKRVVIEAHADEIAWSVSHIDDSGYLYMTSLGGSDIQIAPSKRAKVFLENGETITGVFGWPAIHVREKDKAPEKEDIILDCGFSSKSEAIEKGVSIGSVAVFEDTLIELNDKFLCGRALDNRIGGYMIAQVAKLIKENNIDLPYTLYIVNAVQEEIGLRGAEMISRRIKPDVAIVTDVTHDTTTKGYNKLKQGDIKCGDGPSVCIAPAIQKKLLKLIFETGTKNDIKFQRCVRNRGTGTDTDSFAYSGEGVASALISLPLKYMHTTNEIVNKSDVEQTIQLIYLSLVELSDRLKQHGTFKLDLFND